MIELSAQLAPVTAVASLQSVAVGIRPAVRRFGLPLLRLIFAVTVLWFLGRQLGAAPFRDGLRAITWRERRSPGSVGTDDALVQDSAHLGLFYDGYG